MKDLFSEHSKFYKIIIKTLNNEYGFTLAAYHD